MGINREPDFLLSIPAGTEIRKVGVKVQNKKGTGYHGFSIVDSKGEML